MNNKVEQFFSLTLMIEFHLEMVRGNPDTISAMDSPMTQGEGRRGAENSPS